MSDTPQLGDMAIHAYRYKNNVYRDYVMWRRDPHNTNVTGWFNGRGERLGGAAVLQPLPSPEALHAQLALDEPFAYTPKPGDVAVYQSGSGVPVTVMYRTFRTEPGWYTHTNMHIEEVETDPSFQLVLSGGLLQTESD